MDTKTKTNAIDKTCQMCVESENSDNNNETGKEKESRYKIVETKNGFIVSGKDRNTVTVCSDTTGLNVEYAAEHRAVKHRFNFYQYYDFSKCIANGLMYFWERPENHPRKDKWSGLKDWVIKKTAQSIGKEVHQQWKRILNNADTEILNVQRAVFSACSKTLD